MPIRPSVKKASINQIPGVTERPALPGQAPDRVEEILDPLTQELQPSGMIEQLWLADIAYLTARIDFFRSGLRGYYAERQREESAPAPFLDILEDAGTAKEHAALRALQSNDFQPQKGKTHLDSLAYTRLLGKVLGNNLNTIVQLDDVEQRLLRERDRMIAQFDRRRRDALQRRSRKRRSCAGGTASTVQGLNMPGSVIRSKAARAASRSNGAKSRGPRTAQGKARSAGNAIKHGLRSALPRELEQLPSWLVSMEDGLCALISRVDAAAKTLIDSALMVSLRLRQAEAMVDELQAKLLNPGIAIDDMSERDALLGQSPVRALLNQHPFRQVDDYVRLSKHSLQRRRAQESDLRRLMILLRYEKRFRGQRDRALRKLLQRH